MFLPPGSIERWRFVGFFLQIQTPVKKKHAPLLRWLNLWGVLRTGVYGTCFSTGSR